ncbi:sugar nucleotide-binding protein [Methanonatronarchaeum sp. AMET6-2]|uniref:sugar nucleotide-binding protein n=1 Tax=Methanonatronarchaeum sp. AMET6-2 TaxID=2933293 RepID=UPI001FF6FBFA|nr:sugar nucleotide-binding protein [Methanonatronarchaeum sp. AMET6-2]UOY10284.1 sugar nucleotide-binding protein [Methanonatronarchaeum sp. AMET6-2]
MNVLITGASGFLGSRFKHLFGKYYNVAGTYYQNSQRDLFQLDITHKENVIRFVQDLNPDIIIHTAAISDPDFCGKNPEKAVNINEIGTKNVAEAASRVGAKLIYISTSFVFPEKGTYSPDDSPNPQTVYGQTKKDVSSYICHTINVRIAEKLWTANDNVVIHFIFNSKFSIIYTLAENGVVELDDSVKRYPSFVDDVIWVTERLLDINANGVYHLGTNKAYTKYEFGRKVADTFNIKGEIVPVEKKSFVQRPSEIKLDTRIERLGVTIRSVTEALNTIKHQRGCSFKTIYSFKPDELIKGQSANKVRAKLGKELGKDEDIDADIVIPVPESGIYPATGYADKTGIPLYHGIIRDYKTEKTLYEPNIEERNRKLRKKLIAVGDIIEGKRVVIVDEAIISGLTLSTVIDKCQNIGVKEIHIRIPSPPMRSRCKYGVLSDDADLVVDNSLKEIEEIQNYIQKKFNLDSIRYLSKERFRKIVPSDYGFTCIKCFKRLEG